MSESFYFYIADIFTQTTYYNGMTQNRFAVASQAPIVCKYKNLKHKVLKYNENIKNLRGLNVLYKLPDDDSKSCSVDLCLTDFFFF